MVAALVVVSAAYLLFRDVIVETGEKSTAKNRIAIVIDDIGYDLSPVNEILSMDIPISLSILPCLPFSVEAAEKAQEKGKEILLHLPMEPYGYPEKNPGEGCLLIDMKQEEIETRLLDAIDNVPHVSGVNNHMGSRFMEDEERLEMVLRHLKKRDLFFLDSLTTRNSKGRNISKKIGLKYIARDVFIDNHSDVREARERLLNIIKRKDGWNTMVLIGHPYESTVEAIRETIPLFRAEGIEIVTLSDLIELNSEH